MPRLISHPRAEVIVYPDAQALSRAAADEFLRAGRAAVARHGRFVVALAGGSTPKTAYAMLAQDEQNTTAAFPWNRVDWFFGDERAVPPDQSDSNYHMAHDALLAKVPVPSERVHRIRAELDPRQAAADYEAEIRRVLAAVPGTIPRFDLILLGMGADGHTASLFPGTGGLEERQALVCANWVEKFQTYRLTFTFPLLNAAAAVMFVAAGGEKAGMLRNVLRGDPSGQTYPAQLVQPTAGRLLWMLDEAAAKEL